jgi:hypothetical protein|nr:MAG TPA: homing endonuclease [Caudoviricetes sp.]
MVLKYHRLEFNHKYFISNRGFVISLVRRFRLLNIRRDKNGYVHYYIRDTVTGKRKDYKAHRLVAEAFIPNPNKLPIINHIDGNKANNRIENLEWCTQSYNNIHAFKTGLSTPGYKPCVINGEYYASQSEAAEKLGVCRHTVDNWIKLGKGYYIKCD